MRVPAGHHHDAPPNATCSITREIIPFYSLSNGRNCISILENNTEKFSERDSLSKNLLVRKYGSKNTRKFGTTARSAGCRCCLLDITAVRAAGGSVSFIRRSVRF